MGSKRMMEMMPLLIAMEAKVLAIKVKLGLRRRIEIRIRRICVIEYANGLKHVIGKPCKVNEVMFWVKKRLSAHVSAGSGSGGLIWRIQLMDAAY
ncbi:hypothetical protein Tco_1315889 [Tanacetum coccineum]